ncbi:hypothetical protein BH23PAT1_BH23PAT1_1430 [soil metagenome]
MIIVLSIIIGALLVLLAIARHDINRLKKQQPGVLSGIGALSVAQTKTKNKNKARIIQLFESRQVITNSEVRDLLGVSSRTTVRYLDELEAEGKVKQIGNTGRGVGYRRKT